MTYTAPIAPPRNLVDGWAAILDRDGVVPGTSGPTKKRFCPSTIDDAGYNDSFYYDDTSPMGYFGMAGGPARRCSPAVMAPTPAGACRNELQGYNGLYDDEVRCSYWLTGIPQARPAPTIHLRQQVGYVTVGVLDMGCGRQRTVTVVMGGIAWPEPLVTDGIYPTAIERRCISPTRYAFRIGYRHNGASGKFYHHCCPPSTCVRGNVRGDAGDGKCCGQHGTGEPPHGTVWRSKV